MVFTGWISQQREWSYSLFAAVSMLAEDVAIPYRAAVRQVTRHLTISSVFVTADFWYAAGDAGDIVMHRRSHNC